VGADRFWAALAGIALLGCPVYMASATTFMTDVPYVALLTACVLCAVLWAGERRAQALCIVLACLATLQRQTGMMIPLGVTAGLLLAWRGKPWPRKDLLYLALLWVATGAAYFSPIVAGIEPPTQANRLAAITSVRLIYPVGSILFLPGMIGLAALPFAAALLWGPGRPAGARAGARRLVLGLAIWEIATMLLHKGNLFPGNVFTPAGLQNTLLFDAKPHIYSPAVFLLLGLGAFLAGAGLLRRSYTAIDSRLKMGALVLIPIAAAQFLPLLGLTYVAFDRYYLPGLALATPILAALAARSSHPRAAAGIALASIGVGLALYAVGEQDFQAMNVARDQAARLAYEQASPLEVNAGYEPNAVYGEVANYERTGTILSALGRAYGHDFSVGGPEHPILVVELVSEADPRPGVVYRSLVPGKVVITRPLP
jgi:hypothetical protein